MNQNKHNKVEEKMKELWERYHYLKSLNRVGYVHLFNDFEKALTSSYEQGVRDEYKRCVDLLDHDHKSCPIKETCIGYQNAQSDLMNQPPLKNN